MKRKYVSITTEEVYNHLNNAYKLKNPCSLLRYGDGEGVVTIHASDMLSLRYRGKTIKDWGVVPPLNIRNQISRDMIFSFENANIIGFPDKDAGKSWEYAAQFFSQFLKEQIICSMEIHIDLERENYLKELIQNRNVFYISCRNVDEFLLNTYKAKNVDKIIVPEQHRFARIKPQVPIFKKLKKIEEKIISKNLSNTICLLGAGTAGKKLGILMRQQGGIVIDIGSVFDLWSGKQTRSWIKQHD